MTFLLLGLLALAALLPLALVLWRAPRARGRRAADLALYRAQLAELDRERALGRMDEAAHQAATLEVQRRLLATPGAAADAAAGGAGRAAAPPRPMALLLALLLIPTVALGTYLLHGAPGTPSAPLRLRQEAAARDEALLAQLRARLAAIDPRSEAARQGWLLLGEAERNRGRAEAALAAWDRALAARFDPSLAAMMAELQIDRDQPEAARALLDSALAAAPADPRLRYLSGVLQARSGENGAARRTWQALLADSPADAPWRRLVEQRLAELPGG
ncbi:c-type cytochrome biogenesis protein CcmI [Roseomonas sp. NAR14]|uniref:C-type cytochrome biogenesis protein CcmI n=1 Tax=Roseomonas acroporae TaxID=2937791 RepID=A0A9X1Y803_9PROT|nr:c-type cytochrome biogenesis protein CcmI [Roseomonas acroporae]MCK8785839.1 c-type cytochrome biogenesis protein CcmI [Roseomonas acroporae]